MTLEPFAQLLPLDPMRIYTPADAMQLAESVAGLTEAERKKLSKIAREASKAARRENDFKIVEIAVLAVCPFSDVRKLRKGYYSDTEPIALKVLLDRRPDWLDEYVAFNLSGKYPMISWWLLRELIRAGACRKPASDGYVQLFAAMVGPWSRHDGVLRSQRLLDAPDLIDDVWRLFEVETSAFFLDVTQPGRHVDNYEDWHATLLRLSEMGRLDRQRLIDCCVRAIGADFSATTLTGFIHFHDRLAVTSDELAARQSAYFDLLTSRSTRVVTFALAQLTDLQKAGRLDGASFLSAAGSVFSLKPKGQPQQVLNLTAKLVKAAPELVPEAANLAIQALTHESSEVQAAATKLLDGWRARLHRDHSSEMRDKLAGLSATVRPKIETLIHKLSPADETAIDSPSSIEPHSWDEWQTRIAAIDPPWRIVSGLEDALQAAQSDCVFGGIWFNVNCVPVLTSCRPIVPIESVDELLDAVAHALEHVESADELERILDGVSRLCDQRPGDFELRAGPLVKRLTDERRGNPGSGMFSIWRMSRVMHRLLLRWLLRDDAPRSGQFSDSRTLPKFIDRRLSEIKDRVVVRRAVPLLCAPTHEHGWLDPREFVRRARFYATWGQEPPRADLIQAVLRLAPDHRSESLTEAGDLPDDWGQAIRFALGSQEQPLVRDDKSFTLWLAGARSRQAEGPLSDRGSVVGPSREPLLIAPRYVWEPEVAEANELSWATDGAVSLRLSVEPELPIHPASDLIPTLAICEPHSRWDLYGAEWCRCWLTAVWPANLDAMLVEGVRALCERVNAPASAFDPNHHYLRPLLQTDRPWNELAYLAIWLALLSKDTGSRGMAIDVMIAGIEDGRAQPNVKVLLKLSQAKWMKLNRLADAAREIARVSPRHAWWIAELLQRFVSDLESWPVAMQHVLALLLDLLAELGLALDDDARLRLDSVKAEGKSAKLLKSILACVSVPASANRSAAHEQALQSCRDRAERWSQGRM